ncbi:uncharacterized protein LOC117179693 [Belonocnema kinseyi]|uniref:uncharacterized protein LOC117179693 n=1 Tax=Belonocnema kinseyi TaxID=2817044 RepID=UPI00143DE46F|nr:uncharacterized protein LOC117179693 [Belonocnema kinseyi]
MSNEKRIIMDVYEALIQLQYPKITLVNPKDVETQILTGENRVCLLSWLLHQNPKFTFPPLNKLKGAALEEELFKYYSQIGICSDKDKLLGKCSLKSQISTLKLLLLFMRNINANQKTEDEADKVSISDTLQEYFEKDVNIIPAGFSISTKLTQAETNKYIEETKMRAEEVRTMISDSKDQVPESKSKSSVEERLASIQEVQNEKYKPSLEKFTESFKNLDTGPQAQKRPLQNSFNMNEIICKMESSLSTIKQALYCKDDIMRLSIPTGLHSFNSPLLETVDDSVFWLQRVSNVQTEGDDL